MVPRHQRNDRSQIAAGAVADEGNLVGRDAEQVAVQKQLACHQIAILRRRREFILGSKLVVHRHDDVPGQARHISADLIVGVDIAGDPAAAVEKQQHRKGPVQIRGKDPHRDIVVACPNLVVPNLVKGTQDMGVGSIDHRALQAIAVLFIENLGVGEGLEGRPHKTIDCHRAVSSSLSFMVF